MINFKLLLILAYSAWSACSNAVMPYVNVPKSLPPREYFMEYSSRNQNETSVITKGIYVPVYDVNSDGRFDASDAQEIKRLQDIMKQKTEKENNEKTEPPVEAVVTDIQEMPVIETQDTEPAPAIAPEVIVTEAPAPEIPDVTPPAAEENTANVSGIENAVMNGIDVSRWQGRIDWQKVKDCGVEFAIIKAGEGTEVEQRFYENINNAKAVGMNCGIYWFSQARSPEDAELEAQACLNAITGYQLEFPVVYDCEYRSLNDNPLSENKSLLTDTVLTFLDKIQSSGYYSMFYTNTDFSDRYLEFNRITDLYDIWFASYYVSAPAMPCGMWQRSETGRVDGLDMDRLNGDVTYVDLDVAYKNYPDIMKSLHINGY